jgi:RNA polymerase sigma-70 factor, ECF subfamily
MTSLLQCKVPLLGFDSSPLWNSVETTRTRMAPERGVNPATDVDLMERVARGEARAYRELVDRHVRGVHVFVQRMLGNRAEAEEVCQETFLRLWTQAGTYVVKAKPSTWLYRIAHNLAVDRLRRRREGGQPLDLEQVPASGRPSLALYDKQVAEAVQRALDELPPRQRAAISLVHYQGMTGAEAAEVLGVKLRALESLLARGRQQLREQLAAFQSEGTRE